jgi:hypothetical protein
VGITHSPLKLAGSSYEKHGFSFLFLNNSDQKTLKPLPPPLLEKTKMAFSGNGKGGKCAWRDQGKVVCELPGSSRG